MRKEKKNFIGRYENSFIPITLIRLGYIVFALDNCTMKLYIKTGLNDPDSVRAGWFQ